MTIKRGKIGREDINYGSGSFNRTDRTGNPIPITKVIDPSIEHNNDGTHKDVNTDSLTTDSLTTKSPWVDVTHPDFGAVGDGVTDDTAAIIAAITYAVANGIGVIFFPEGIYLCGSKIVDSTTLGEGLTFVGTGRLSPKDETAGSVIKYTGSSVCWDITQPNGTASVGRWNWENLTFHCTDDAGGMFQFNDTTDDMTDDSTSPNYIREVSFKRCLFWGARNEATVTGRAIQGLGVFDLNIDDNCEFNGWGRAVYMKGCENSNIRGRFLNNVRHIQIARSNTFGNDNKIDARFLGQPYESGTEDAYHIYDEGNGTTIMTPYLEKGSKGLLYLNGLYTGVFNPRFGLGTVSSPNHVAIKLGADARDVFVYSPQGTGSGAICEYDTPTSWDWGGNDWNYQMTIVAPSEKFMRNIFVPDARVRVVGAPEYIDNTHPAHDNIQITSNGTALKEVYITPFNLGRVRSNGIGYNDIDGVIADTGGHFGYAIALPVSSVAGFAIQLEVGQHINEGDTVTATFRYRLESTKGAGTFRWQVQKNGTNVTNAEIGSSTTYANVTPTGYTLSGFSAGDTIEIGCYNSGALDVRALIAAMKVVIS